MSRTYCPITARIQSQGLSHLMKWGVALAGFFPVLLTAEPFAKKKCPDIFLALPSERISLKAARAEFLAKIGKPRATYPVDVDRGHVVAYKETIVPNSTELFNQPGYRNKKGKIQGHTYYRVAGTLYDLTAEGRMERRELEYLYEPDPYGLVHRSYGYVFEVSPSELAHQRVFYEGLVREGLPYNLYQVNCSSIACKGMSEAGIVDIPWPFYLEPSLARIFAASTRRVALRTRYNNNSADTHTEIIWGQLLHRFKHYRRWMLGR